MNFQSFDDAQKFIEKVVVGNAKAWNTFTEQDLKVLEEFITTGQSVLKLTGISSEEKLTLINKSLQTFIERVPQISDLVNSVQDLLSGILSEDGELHLGDKVGIVVNLPAGSVYNEIDDGSDDEIGEKFYSQQTGKGLRKEDNVGGREFERIVNMGTDISNCSGTIKEKNGYKFKYTIKDGKLTITNDGTGALNGNMDGIEQEIIGIIAYVRQFDLIELSKLKLEMSGFSGGNMSFD